MTNDPKKLFEKVTPHQPWSVLSWHSKDDGCHFVVCVRGHKEVTPNQFAYEVVVTTNPPRIAYAFHEDLRAL